MVSEKTGSQWFIILQRESQLQNIIQSDFDNETLTFEELALDLRPVWEEMGMGVRWQASHPYIQPWGKSQMETVS